MKKIKPAFTLIELLVVIAIIGILSTLAVVSLTNARQSARDTKRLADVKQIQTALELYYNDTGSYPSSITDSIATSGITYMQTYPTAPTPADGDCSDSDNAYNYTVSGTENSSYSLTFCLGSQVNNLDAGIKEAIPGGILSILPQEEPTWQVVGTAGFSSGIAYVTSLAIYNGTPYVAYGDGGNSNKATVMKFNGTSWELVGTAGFSTGAVYGISLIIYNETPYVAYMDGVNSYKATVMKFNGTSWELVGTAGFSAGAADSPSLAIYNGTPYVAYRDGGNSDKATVMKFD